MGTAKDSEKTKAKLIAAAGPLFAERGYKAVTARDITQAAGVPLGTLNYHFQSKEGLYREVLLEACRETALTDKDQAQLSKLPPREALYVLIRESIKDYEKQKPAVWHGTVLTRECWQPSEVFGQVVEAYFQPQIDYIARLVGQVVGKERGDLQVRFAVISLLGLMDTFGEYGPLIDAVAPGLHKRLKKRNLLARQLFEIVIETAKADVT